MQQTQLSHSRMRLLLSCGRKYKLHYEKRIRPKYTYSYFHFGGAIDQALNTLLKNKNLKQAKEEFEERFKTVIINGEIQEASENPWIRYSAGDLDLDLLATILTPEEFEEASKTHVICQDVGYKDLSEEQLITYNYYCWRSLYKKAKILIEEYYNKVLPRFKNVLEVQKTIEVFNDTGDRIKGILDLIVEFDDGKRYLLDNKTSSVPYANDSARRSQQLVLYYLLAREEYKLDGVGFVVLGKKIIKNRNKVCTKCGFDGSNTRFKSCNNEISGERCGGAWDESVFFASDIRIITDSVPVSSQTMVLDIIDEANFKIKNGLFAANFDACKNMNRVCEYFNYCHNNETMDDLTVVEETPNGN